MPGKTFLVCLHSGECYALDLASNRWDLRGNIGRHYWGSSSYSPAAGIIMTGGYAFGKPLKTVKSTMDGRTAKTHADMPAGVSSHCQAS